MNQFAFWLVSSLVTRAAYNTVAPPMPPKQWNIAGGTASNQERAHQRTAWRLSGSALTFQCWLCEAQLRRIRELQAETQTQATEPRAQSQDIVHLEPESRQPFYVWFVQNGMWNFGKAICVFGVDGVAMAWGIRPCPAEGRQPPVEPADFFLLPTAEDIVAGQAHDGAIAAAAGIETLPVASQDDWLRSMRMPALDILHSL